MLLFRRDALKSVENIMPKSVLMAVGLKLLIVLRLEIDSVILARCIMEENIYSVRLLNFHGIQSLLSMPCFGLWGKGIS